MLHCRHCPRVFTQDEIEENARLKTLLEQAWQIIANAGEGDWTREHPHWQQAANLFRDKFHREMRGTN